VVRHDVRVEFAARHLGQLGDGRVEFRLWAPSANRVTLKLWRNGQAEPERFQMRRLGSADFGMPDLDEPDAETWMLTTLAATPSAVSLS